MLVLITGAAGRVGSALAQQCVQAGYDVRGMVRPGGREIPPSLARNVDVVEASLTDADAVAGAVAGADVVVHLAAQMVIGDMPADTFYDINVLGTLRLLEASVSQERPVRRFVFASTDNTYGPARPHPPVITEEHPQAPGDYYGTAKLLCEQLVTNYHHLHELEYVIMRLGSVRGPGEAAPLFRLDWVHTFLSAQAAAGRRSNLWPLLAECDDPVGVLDATVGPHSDNPATVLTGPGGEPWSIHLTDVRDVVDGMMLGIHHPAAVNQAFNIVGPRTTTFAEAAEVIAKRFDTDVVTAAMPMKLAFELSTAKARRMLGYRPAWDFEGMLDTVPAGDS